MSWSYELARVNSVREIMYIHVVLMLFFHVLFIYL